MNYYAKQFKMQDTQFSNVHGMLKNNKSSCIDLAKISIMATNDQVISKVCSTYYYQCFVKNGDVER